MNTEPTALEITKRTQWGYAATRILDTPFWGIFNMLPIILYKDLNATPLQLAVIVALKPLVAIFSSYWSAWINSKSDQVVSKIIFARFIVLLPFLLPFYNSVWFYIAAFGMYWMVALGIVPTWMQLLKTNVPDYQREKLFSYTQAFGYLGGGLLPFALGGVLDHYHQAWRWLFPLAAVLSLFSIYFQMKLIIKGTASLPVQNLKHRLMHPWKSAWKLLQNNVNFSKYQIGFMLIGSGLMIMQPALPIYFVDTLKLSYTELAIALTLCKGIGFAAGSPLWSKYFNKVNIFKFSGYVACLAALFPLALVMSQYQISWLYISYLAYGFMQSGNELSWNMSGPFFAKEGDSTVYTNINTMAIGIRGAFIPALGGLFITLWGAAPVMVLGGCLCLTATLCLLSFQNSFVSKACSS